MRSAALLAVALCAPGALAADYAVIAATSQGYSNYRHQADVAHAYQVLSKGGIPVSNIITFLYDDVAHSSENPFPGKLFNAPTKAGEAGVDVYAGIKIDYKGSDVTASNFISVLTGDSAAVKGKGTGRVLKSGKHDRVFVYVCDHGAPGLVAFPQDMLHAEDLLSALKTMGTQQMFSELVFYLEACESGSMFENLPSNIKILATTASNPSESSWGTYCGSDAVVDGRSLNTCLGDLFSVNWLQNADSQNLKTETLQAQFLDVKQKTTKSHVMQYGEMDINSQPAANFEGSEATNATATAAPVPASFVNSRDAKLDYLYHAYLNAAPATRSVAAARLSAEISSREHADKVFAAIGAMAAPGVDLSLPAPLVHRQCHRAAHEAVGEFCGGYSDYSLKYASTMIAACEAVSGDFTRVTAAVRSVC